MSEPLLNLSVVVSVPAGTLELNDRVTYRIADGSFAEQSVSKRRQEASNPFLEGAFTVNALRENVTETLKVYVYGTTHAEFAAAMNALKAAFDQARFTVTKTVEGSAVVWSCFSSDYRMSTPREFVHSKMGTLEVSLVRHPVEA